MNLQSRVPVSPSDPHRGKGFCRRGCFTSGIAKWEKREDGYFRDYWFTGCGKGAEWFDQYFFDLMQSRTSFISYLKRGDYYKAFDEMLDYVNIFLEEATTGEQPYNFDHPYTEVK